MMKIYRFIVSAILIGIFSACTPQANNSTNRTPTQQSTSNIEPTVTNSQPTRTQAPPDPTSTPTARANPTFTATAPASLSPTPAISPTEELVTSEPSAAIIIDHNSIDLFDSIPDEYILSASQLSWLHRHASVGQNIYDGLRCLMNDFDTRPSFCDRDLDPGDIIYDNKYDYRNWTFELHAPLPNPNPAWWAKTSGFVERIDELKNGETYDVASYNVCYVDGIENSSIDKIFFNDTPGDRMSGILDLERIENENPSTKFVYWTMCLARIVGTENSTSFNEQMRQYVRQRGKYLYDLADIESHTPEGDPCLNEQGYPVICQQYTNEKNAGHLNSLGRLRAAKAVWVLMARLAGWDGSP